MVGAGLPLTRCNVSVLFNIFSAFTIQVPNLGLENVDSQISRQEKLFALKHFIDTLIKYRHSSRSSKLSLDYPDTFLNYPDTLRIVRKLSRSPQHISRSSGFFLDYLDTFSRLSGHCLDRTETFQIIHTLFRLSGHIF